MHRNGLRRGCMHSSSRFNQAVLLQMPGVSVDLLKAPPVLTGIGAWWQVCHHVWWQVCHHVQKMMIVRCLMATGCCECYVHTSTSRVGSIFLHSAVLFWCTQPRMGWRHRWCWMERIAWCSCILADCCSVSPTSVTSRSSAATTINGP